MVAIECFFIILLIAASYADIKTMHIPLWLVILCIITAGISVLNSLISENKHPSDYFGTVAVILVISFLYLLSRAAHTEGVGSGDILLIGVAGVLFTWRETIVILLVAFTAAGLFSGILLIFKKAGRKSRIPFIPFLTIGTVYAEYMCIRGYW